MSTVNNISIILPVYNVENYVKDCLGSIVSQTKTKGVECLIIDDCGTDNSIEQIFEFLNTYKGPVSFRLLHHEHNKGLSAARNTGIKEASGEYLYFLDSDDRFYSNDSLELLYNLVKVHPGVDMVQGNFYIEENQCLTFNKGIFPAFTDKKGWIQSNLITMTIPESACNRLIKRNVIINNNLYFKEGWIQEDTLWTYQISRYIESIAFCMEPTYLYANNSNSIVHTSGNEKEANAYIKILNEVYQRLQIETMHSYDIIFLEKMAARAEQANGIGVYASMLPYKKPILRIIFKLNSIGFKSKNVLGRYACKFVTLFLRYFACSKFS